MTAPSPKRQRIDPHPHNNPSQGTSTDTFRNDLLSNFNGAGISNAGGNFHIVGNVHVNANASPQPPATSDNRKELLESLRCDQIDVEHDSIKKAHAKTCRWFLETDVYKKWEEMNLSEFNNFLWIKGKPGAGKSTLMKFLYSQIRARTRRKTNNEILISFFFNARGHELEKSTIGLYRSLLWQLLDKKPDMQQILDDLQPGYQWTVESLKSRLEEVIQGLGGIHIICLIDALDECDQDQIRDMVLFLEELVDEQSSLHVCFASRHYPHITIQTSLDIILEEREGHAQDIAAYLNSALRIKPNELAEEVRSEMQKKADGVFIWVVLVVDILNKEYDSGRKYRLRERLSELPGNLHLLFRDILTRDTKNRAGLLLCIQWVLFAKEPLTPRQLYLAILSGTEPEFLPRCHSETLLEDDVQRYILDNSKGLAQSTRSKVPTVQFIHESVRDFLLKSNGLDDLFDGLESNIHAKSHEALKDCCLTYMGMDSIFRLSLSICPFSEAIQAFPFLDYANSRLLFHANEAEHHGISQESFLTEFPHDQWVSHHNFLEKSEIRKYTEGVSLLYILAEAGLPDLIRAHSDRQSCFKIENERYGVPILAASALKHETTVQAMLEREAERLGVDFADFCERFKTLGKKSPGSGRSFKFRQNRSLIDQLIEHGDDQMSFFFLDTHPDVEDRHLEELFSLAFKHDKIGTAAILARNRRSFGDQETLLHRVLLRRDFQKATFLINSGADVSAADNNGGTPLHYACGHPQVTQLLLDRGADVSAVDNKGKTPLHYACNYPEVTQLLLDRGADVSAADNNGNTPLHGAFFYNEVAQLLLYRGADALAANNNGETYLHDAFRYGLFGAPQLLGDGVDVFISNKDGMTIFHVAVQKGQYGLAHWLLGRGASISAPNKYGVSPLHIVAQSGNLSMARWLLSCGADVFPTDYSGRTPLHAASLSDLEIARLLLDHGADVQAVDASGETPLHFACGLQKVGIIQLLIDNGANISAANAHGETPLHRASECIGGNKVEVVQLLLNHGADISANDNSQQTPLHYACRAGHNVIAGLLIDRGADVSAVDIRGETPLHQACQSSFPPSIIGVLLRGGADSSATNNNGETPLHQILLPPGLIGLQSGLHPRFRLQVVRMFVNSGADCLVSDINDHRPIDYALSEKWEAIVDFLKSRLSERGGFTDYSNQEGPLLYEFPKNNH